MIVRTLLLTLSLTLSASLMTGCFSLLPALPTITVASSDYIGVAPLSVSFSSEITLTGKRTSDSWTFRWDFGDGQLGKGPEPKHTYVVPGEYKATLTVSNGDDFNTQRSVGVRVLSEPRFSFSRFATGLTPMAAAVMDLNVDDRKDLLAANARSHNISVMIYDGGTYEVSPYQYPAIKSPSPNPQPQSITVGDINGDTRMDLVVLNPPDDNVTLLFGNGIGGFETPSGYEIKNPVHAVVSEFHGDGNNDVLILSKTGIRDRLILMQGRGTGELTLGTTILEQEAITDFVLADFDRDGDIDIAISTKEFSLEIMILLNEGGHFAPPIHGLLSGKPDALVAIDFDSDGYVDLISANDDGSFSLARGDGTGHVTMTGTISTQLKNLSHLFAADLNGDHNKDLIFQHHRNGTTDLAVMVGDGWGNFSKPILLSGFNGTLFPIATRVDDDDLVDLVVVNPQTNELLLATNTTPQQ